ncbi:hypothetical protein J559_1080 [Acinetobacter sp. 983759]|uniref:DUF6670 family protein n=1 Tax=Acinetobacter TaxID=469 RepID=UPI00044DA974|nr:MULTISPECIES: DUF6670 family protein [Acinetobacter]EXE14695.1 hypothetical protein J559_1080 [Acinetobacter sp. 983759]MCK4107517.1 hypothetical protein [Acinetobacter radioresistens]
MVKLITSLNQSQQLNPKSFSKLNLAYHPPKGRFKIIHQGLILPNLPAPLHYLNFISIIGQPRIPVFFNQSAILEQALDTATVLVSSSPHMVGQLKSYSVKEQCFFNSDDFSFADIDQVSGELPVLRIKRQSPEFSIDLNVVTLPVLSQFIKIKWGLFEHWSLLCQCKGEVYYQEQRYLIEGTGSFEYARAANIPVITWCFFTYQVINLSPSLQVLLLQIRNNFNQLVQSHLYVRDIAGDMELHDKNVIFKVDRVYPKVTTPNGKEMYLPREFSWCVEHEGQILFELHAQSRGDFKFGLAAGYVGSFRYQAHWEGESYEGESGYIEYIDCRPLRWQEKNEQDKILDQLSVAEPCILKK